MKQIWLRKNPRIGLALAVVPTVAALVGAAMLLAGLESAARNVSIVLLLGGGLAALLVAARAFGPRVAYRDGKVCFYVRLGSPSRVPIECVECFLLGHGPTLLPGEHNRKSETRTVVVRLAEKAEEWRHGPFHPLLAAWCDGYITIRGTWCEPLSIDVINRLNRQLHEAQQAAKR